MSTIKRSSFLGVPLEVRVEVYRYIFEEVRLYLLLTTRARPTKVQTREDLVYSSIDDMVDHGISLACRSVRIEVMPILREALILYCDIDNQFHGPGTFPIRVEYAECIKKVHIEFSTDLWTVSFKNLPSLVLVTITPGEDYEPIYLGEAYQDELKEWAKAKDVESLVKVVKSEARYATGDWGTENTLDNEDRGFRVLWRDRVRTIEDGDCAEFQFDWDTLEVIEGTEDIMYDFERVLRFHEDDEDDEDD